MESNKLNEKVEKIASIFYIKGITEKFKENTMEQV